MYLGTLEENEKNYITHTYFRDVEFLAYQC